MKNRVRNFFVALVSLALFTLNIQLSMVHAQGTAFAYQGQLQSGGSPVSGTFNLTFKLFTAGSGGTAVAGPVTNNAVAVTNGLFSVVIDFGASVWNGETNWLELAVRTNGNGSFTILSPRQQITPIPYAITAENVLGMQIQSNTNGAPNVILGSPNNFVSAGVIGATISGGGVTNQPEASYITADYGTIGGGAANSVWGQYGTVGGGIGNFATNQYATIGGGFGNIAGGFAATVGGGDDNIASDQSATVGGGFGNIAGGFGATVGGGDDNIASGQSATVGGGYYNNASGYEATLGGGSENTNSGYASTISGGTVNIATGDYSTVGGGTLNQASGPGAVICGGGYAGGGYLGNLASGGGSFIGGGQGNNAGSTYVTIGGGLDNSASVYYGTVGGGLVNTNTGFAATVGGGYNNNAAGPEAMVGGGQLNIASNSFATVPGGQGNVAGGLCSFAAGDQADAQYDGDFVWADSSGGVYNATATNQFAVRASGGILFAGDLQLLGGAPYHNLSLSGGNAIGYLYGSYPALGDGIHLGYNYYYDAGGTGHVFNTGGATSRISAQYGQIDLAIGAVNAAPTTDRLIANSTGVTVYGTFDNLSDRNAKQDFAPVSSGQILDKVSQLPVSEWSYKEDPKTRHVGPVAQDFYSIFKIGTDDRHIAPIDEGGVALAAIQGLDRKVESENASLRAENAALKKQNDSLAERLDQLEQTVKNLAAGN